MTEIERGGLKTYWALTLPRRAPCSNPETYVAKSQADPVPH